MQTKTFKNLIASDRNLIYRLFQKLLLLLPNTQKMSKAGRSVKDMIQKSRTTGIGTSLSNVSETNDVKFPKIKNQKADTFLITEQPETYNFTKTKRETPSVISKDLMEGLDDNEKVSS